MHNSKDDWLEISRQIRGIHPVMIEKLDRFEGIMARVIEAGKQSVALRDDLGHLAAVGIITKEECAKLTDGLRGYCVGQFQEVFQAFATCLGTETQAQILSKVFELASELEPEYQQLLVNCAVELRKVEMGRQSPD